MIIIYTDDTVKRTNSVDDHSIEMHQILICLADEAFSHALEQKSKRASRSGGCASPQVCIEREFAAFKRLVQVYLDTTAGHI